MTSETTAISSTADPIPRSSVSGVEGSPVAQRPTLTLVSRSTTIEPHTERDLVSVGPSVAPGWSPSSRSGVARRRPPVIDGHVLYPCGCMWNVRFRSYSKRCLSDDRRTTTPPHGETEIQCPPKSKKTVVQRRGLFQVLGEAMQARKKPPGRHRAPSSTDGRSRHRKMNMPKSS